MHQYCTRPMRSNQRSTLIETVPSLHILHSYTYNARTKYFPRIPASQASAHAQEEASLWPNLDMVIRGKGPANGSRVSAHMTPKDRSGGGARRRAEYKIARDGGAH